MTRDFIFDSAGQVIGYRCRIDNCQARPFNKVRGLWQHQYRMHGYLKQARLFDQEILDQEVRQVIHHQKEQQ